MPGALLCELHAAVREVVWGIDNLQAHTGASRHRLSGRSAGMYAEYNRLYGCIDERLKYRDYHHGRDDCKETMSETTHKWS